MKILWVKAGGLLPLDSGGRIRSYHIIRQLARSHSLTVFTFYAAIESDQNPELQSFLHRCICFPMPLASTRSGATLLRYGSRLLSGQPFAFVRFCRPSVSKALRSVALSDNFDVIICDFLLSCGVIPWDISIPKIIFTHNVEATIWRRHFRASANPFWKLVYWREWKSMKKTERLFLERAGKVLTVSDTDKDSLSALLDPSRISTIPTGVDTDYFRSSNLPQLPHSIVFVGSMDWMPNEDGILFFMERIFPLVRRTFQCATIKIVGRNPSAKLIRALKQYSQVTLTGRVDDIRPYLDEAEVCIVPLRVGSGTRLKIFEAMSMGKAVVTTTLGAEGLPVTDGNNVLVANTEKDFADAVIRLMQDAGLRSRIGRAARTLVEREYSWRSVGDTFARSVEDFLAHDRPLGAAAD